MSNDLLTNRPEFRALQDHYKDIAPQHMQDMFAKDSARFEKFHAKDGGILLDYSKHRVTDKTLSLLIKLAESCDVQGHRGKMFSGFPVNTSENRPALHAALRGSVEKNLTVDGENVQNFVNDTLKKIKSFTDKIRAEKKFTDIVNLGTGGSDLGARTVCEALSPFCDGPKIHFVANIDSDTLKPLLEKLKPESALFIVVSKSFTTAETMANAEIAKSWLGYHLDDEAVQNHFAAVTENSKAAEKFGVKPDHVFPMRKWTGGRTSVWGSAGLPIALATGFENFEKFLDGAKAMDNHFRTTPIEKNIPVITALLGIWYRNFFGFGAHAVIPYAANLQTFPAWMRQLDMEFNGKSVSKDGTPLDYQTAPVIFGEPGTDAQHAFFQALHQGTDIIPCDFILRKSEEDNALNANALAQAKGLMEGLSNKAEPHKNYPGNRPSSTIVLDRLDPFHLGLLLALYEHKIFVQGIIWNINSFDQWGVELGKNLSKDIVQTLENKTKNANFDSSSLGLICALQSRFSK